MREKGCVIPHELTHLEGELMQQYLEDILQVIGDTVDVDQVIHPIYNYKAGNE